eukprot:scaffold28475_cov15-Tisochrysis_lutea.AAC.1
MRIVLSFICVQLVKWYILGCSCEGAWRPKSTLKIQIIPSIISDHTSKLGVNIRGTVSWLVLLIDLCPPNAVSQNRTPDACRLMSLVSFGLPSEGHDIT